MPGPPRIALFGPANLSARKWWPKLHPMIIEAFQHKAHNAFPPTWTRLDKDPVHAADGLVNEIGPYGRLAVIFDTASDEPIACGAITPFRGLKYINESSSTSTLPTDDNNAAVNNHPVFEVPDSAYEADSAATVESWETCCICVSPSWRGKHLSAKLLKVLEAYAREHGGRRLYSNYCIEETGAYWQSQGYENIKGSESTLPQGWKPDFHPSSDPGLQHDIHFRVGVKEL